MTPPGPTSDLRPSKLLVLAAFAAIYFIWGSTFLAVRIAVETLPPLIMAGGRFFLPGLVICLVAFRLQGKRPLRRDWATAMVVGGSLLVLGSGSVAFAARLVPSSVVALLAATMPLFTTLLGWLARVSPRPAAAGWLGLALGFWGVWFLVRPSPTVSFTPGYTMGLGLALFSPVLWAVGTLYSKKHASSIVSPLLAVGMQLLCGGAVLLLLAALSGEFGHLRNTVVSTRSLLAFLYLATFGSIVAFTAYSWLLRIYSPSLVATYAFVNPVVAVFLGAVLGGESISPQTASGAILIVMAVAITVAVNARPGTRADGAAPLPSEV